MPDFFETSRPVWYALAILFLPLLGFCFNAFTYRWSFTRNRGHVVPLLTIGLALLLSMSLFGKVIMGGRSDQSAVPPHPEFSYSSVDHGYSFSLIDTGPGSFHIEAGVLIDNLTAVMLLVVTVVAFLVHLYSTGYMHGDKRYPRFFAFLGLFSFSMLGLILTDNLMLLFCFWELVGLCSYFLIGFWFDQDEPPKASMKAFMTNRFGDMGFLIGLLIVFQMFGTLNIGEIREQLAIRDFSNPYTWLDNGQLLTLAGLLLFCGPMAKSAQVPMHIWLPDAMAGPTPVSALIHAATMVAAGVYMVGRMYFFFTPETLAFIAVVGAITALLAATIGLVHNNIKKVLAYSTCSQLGYMMLALGVGGYGAGLFHLYTHAFFKACLFLGAGSVIHAVHTEDMREMGGLKNKMPTTYRTFLIATLALAGVPFFSGAFSKELIIEHAMEWGMHGSLSHWLPFVVATFGAVLTFFYMLRLLHLTFWGEPRNRERYDHAHESPSVMTIPLLVLACLAIFSVGWPIPFVGGHTLPEMLAPPDWAAARALDISVPEASHAPTWVVVTVFFLSLGILWAGWTLFRRTYRQQNPGPGWWANSEGATGWWPRLRGNVYETLSGLYYFDEFYEATIVRPGLALSRVFSRFDGAVIDGAVNSVGRIGQLAGRVSGAFDRVVVDGLVNVWWHLSHALSAKLRRLQTGNLQDYLAFAVGGMILVSLMVLIMGT